MSGEKTEPPSPKKLRDARKKGQVPRSQEVVTTLSLFGVLAVIWMMGAIIWDSLVDLVDRVAEIAASDRDTRLQEGLAVTWDTGIAILLPLLGAVVILSVAGNMMQFGVLFSGQSIQPKLEKISPGAGFKRIFSKKQLVELLKSCLKIVFLSFLLYFLVRDSIGPYVSAIACGADCMGIVTKSVIARLLLISAVAFLVVAAFDFMIQRHFHTKSLMMSKDEIKREYKESEGDPMVKGQRKALAQELTMSDGRKQVRKSTAVVVNPTHYAVAIRYEKGVTPLPVVVAKGRGPEAVDIRIEAEAAGVPIFRNVRLARQLYAETERDDVIPDDVFAIVAEILAWVARHQDELYRGTLQHGDLDMERGDHQPAGGSG